METKTRYVEREIPKISLANFPPRIDEITSQLVRAAEDIGFFSIVDHGIPVASIESMFALSESFFALPEATKTTVPWSPQNVGYENRSQVRPSTGAADNKESYQLQFGENMLGRWIDDAHVPGFREKSLEFMHRAQAVSELLMHCFARGLGFPDEFFVDAHDVRRPDSQSTLRLLHYYATPEDTLSTGPIYHRAGAHADWGFLTLLFQRAGQPGLEICPGREVVTTHALGDAWTRVSLGPGDVLCNIGDLLMAWSDDRFKSTFHRVKAPCEAGDYFGERFSMAFFNQPSKETVIRGPRGKYPAVTGREFTANAMQLYYRALEEKMREVGGREGVDGAKTVQTAKQVGVETGA